MSCSRNILVGFAIYVHERHLILHLAFCIRVIHALYLYPTRFICGDAWSAHVHQNRVASRSRIRSFATTTYESRVLTSRSDSRSELVSEYTLAPASFAIR